MYRIQHRYINRDFLIFFKLCAALTIIGLLTAKASQYYMSYFALAATSAIQGTAGPLKSEIHVFYLKNGYWPNTTDFKRLNSYLGDSKTVSNIVIEKGSFHLQLRSNISIVGGQTLSFRKAEFSQQLDTPLWWVCGYSKVPDDMNTNVENKTNINKKYLQRICQ